MRDPAFLFYSKDFYEGTRTMLPEERACYIDLLVYQHQNGGFIPNEIKRVMMYCSGCSEATLKATLKAKFKLTQVGWVNEVLERVMKERENFSGKQKINGTVGQFWKKSKALLSAKDYNLLKELFENQSNEEIFNKINQLEINEATLKAMLVAMLQAKHKHLEDEIEDENEYLKKGVVGEKNFEPLHGKFIEAWKLWISCRSKKFKNEASEAIGRKKFFELCRGDENLAFPIVEQSIANGWAGLFEVKNNSPGKLEIQAKSKQEQQSDRIKNVAQNLIKSLKDNQNADIRPMEIAQVHR